MTTISSFPTYEDSQIEAPTYDEIREYTNSNPDLAEIIKMIVDDDVFLNAFRVMLYSPEQKALGQEHLLHLIQQAAVEYIGEE